MRFGRKKQDQQKTTRSTGSRFGAKTQKRGRSSMQTSQDGPEKNGRTEKVEKSIRADAPVAAHAHFYKKRPAAPAAPVAPAAPAAPAASTAPAASAAPAENAGTPRAPRKDIPNARAAAELFGEKNGDGQDGYTLTTAHFYRKAPTEQQAMQQAMQQAGQTDAAAQPQLQQPRLLRQKSNSASSEPQKAHARHTAEPETGAESPAGRKIQPSVPAASSSQVENKRLLATLCAADIPGAPAEKKRFRASELLRTALMVLFAVIIAASFLNIALQVRAKSRAEAYWDDIRDMFYSEETVYLSPAYLRKDTGFVPEERLYSDTGDIYVAPEIEVLDMHAKFERMLPNLEALRQINAAAFAWIKVEGTRVDYPVVQSPEGDNDYYLSHGLDRTYSVSGAIFLDYANNRKLSENRNSCIYGHNMNDGTMFQTIMNYRNFNQFRNGSIEIYTADGIYLCTPFAVYDALPTESFFRTSFADDAEFEAFLSEIREKSMFTSSETVTAADRIVTLITCTNTVTDKRFVVHAVLRDTVK